MKTVLTILASVGVIFVMAVPVEASELISFADSIVGVHSAPPWSTGNGMVQLDTSSLLLLGGMGELTGSNTLTHRLTRGLGIYGGGQDDEVDIQVDESILITFSGLGYYVNSLEVRSLYTGEPEGTEVAIVGFIKDDMLIHTETLLGIDPAGSGDGVASIDYPMPMLVDELVFTAGNGEFALAKLEVTKLIGIKIDIKPGSYPNAININGKGVIPVAILGSADFDVTQIDLSTLNFAGLAVRVKGNGQPQCSIEDVSGDFSTGLEGTPDGFDDLVCQFVDDPATWTVGNGSAILTGQLIDGTPFEGNDSLKIVSE